MTKAQKEKYRDPDELRLILKSIEGMKFRLDCGHNVTFGHNLSNDITIRQDSGRIVCSLCGYEGY